MGGKHDGAESPERTQAEHPPDAPASDSGATESGRSLSEILCEAGIEQPHKRPRESEAGKTGPIPGLRPTQGDRSSSTVRNRRTAARRTEIGDPTCGGGNDGIALRPLPAGALEAAAWVASAGGAGVVGSVAYESLKSGVRRVVRRKPRLDDGAGDRSHIWRQAREAILERYSDQLTEADDALALEPHTEESGSDGRWVLQFRSEQRQNFTVVIAPAQHGKRWVREVRTVKRQRNFKPTD